MVPLPGGPSDKAGNSFERRWTIYNLVRLLTGEARSLRIEVPGEDGAGSEFVIMVGGVPEWHQVKRQRSVGPWTVSALVSERVVQTWQTKLEAGEKCVFVSSTSADQLRELASRARAANTWEEFRASFLSSRSLRDDFDRLKHAWGNVDDKQVHSALCHVHVHTVDEAFLDRTVQDRLRPLTTGADPATVAAVLERLADDSVHRELTAEDIWEYLAGHGITPRELDRDGALVRRVADTVESYLSNLRPHYIGGQELARTEAGTALNHLLDHHRVTLVGAAGAGKSVITGQVVAMVRDRQWPVLILTADRVSDSATTAELGREIGLPDSPAVVLAGVAAGGDALLVIDQFDAVSIVSGRHPERLRLIADLLREARSYPRLRVLLVCRKFDLENDRALRAVAKDDDAKIVTIGELAHDQVRSALTAAGLSATVPGRLMRLLALPLHLALYVEVASTGIDDINSSRTLTQLYDAYWSSKRAACRVARGGVDEWLPVIKRLVDRMNERQELAVPEAVLDDLDEQVRTMASQGVIKASQGRISFFHETFFDYCFARLLLADGTTVRELLTRSEQDLFRRAQVRQLLSYERGADLARYLADLEWLITSLDVRLHIKILVVSLCETLPDPLPDEWRLLAPIATDQQSPLHVRLWQALRRNPSWFPVLDAAGVWVEMLQAGGALAEQALWALTGHVADHGHRVLELLAEVPQEFVRSRRKPILRLAPDPYPREMVELLLAAVNEGDFGVSDIELSHVLHRLAEDQPAWAAEVLAAVFRRASEVGGAEEGRLHLDSGVRARSVYLSDEIRKIATAAPEEYVDKILPQLLELMRANARPDWSKTELVRDELWGYRVYGYSGALNVDVFDGMCRALAAFARADPVRAAAVFSLLRGEPYESAAFLLAMGYAGNPVAFADAAVDWLVTTPGALMLGYTDAGAWVSRQLIAAISPHCSPPEFDRLVDALLYYATPFERTYRGLRYRGITELCLLNGINPSRRPERVKRRLAELQRKFGHGDVSPPEGVRGGVVPPPIPEDRARRMPDRQWLKAMRGLGTSGPTWRGGRLIGDALTQSRVLETLTKEDPQRFARLLLRIPDRTGEAYVSAILRGLAGAGLDPDLLSQVCRHARSLSSSDANRWLVRLIGSYAAAVEDELVEMVADVAIGDPDPDGYIPGARVSYDIDGAALNSTRSIAAFALRRLITEKPARLGIVEPALRRLVADAQPEVRAAAAAALVPLLHSDAELAFTLFREAADEVLLCSRYVEEFLYHAVHEGHYASVATYVHQMLADRRDQVRRAGARLLVLASYHESGLDQEVDALRASADGAVREAIARVAADNITYAPRRERNLEILSAAFHDPAKAVRDAAARCFYMLAGERLNVYESLMATFSASPAFADNAGAALDVLESSRQPLLPVALDLCEAFVLTHGAAIGDMQTAAAGDAMHVVRLTLRMYAQTTDAAIRQRCLDLVDQLTVLGALEIERQLDTIER